MTKDQLILAALPAVARNWDYRGDEFAGKSTSGSSSQVATATLEMADAIEAAMNQEKSVDH